MKIAQCTLCLEYVCGLHNFNVFFSVFEADAWLALSVLVCLPDGRYPYDEHKWIFNSAQHPSDHNHLWFTISFIEMVNICMPLCRTLSLSQSVENITVESCEKILQTHPCCGKTWSTNRRDKWNIYVEDDREKHRIIFFSEMRKK